MVEQENRRAEVDFLTRMIFHYVTQFLACVAKLLIIGANVTDLSLWNLTQSRIIFAKKI